MITDHADYCIICNSKTEHIHHLVMGNSARRLADADGLTAPLCGICHAVIHTGNAQANMLSRICGQLLYERNEVAKGVSIEDARENFRKRYGKSYL